MGKKIYDDSDLHRLAGFMAEHIEDRFKLGFEALEAIRKDVKRIPQMQADIQELKADVKVMKAALTDTNKEAQDHETRITRLESTVNHA